MDNQTVQSCRNVDVDIVDVDAPATSSSLAKAKTSCQALLTAALACFEVHPVPEEQHCRLQANIDIVNVNVAEAEILAALQTTLGQILTTHQALFTGKQGS